MCLPILCVSNLSRYGDQYHHSIGHDYDYPYIETHTGETFAAFEDGSSTIFSTTSACGQDSFSKHTVFQNREVDLSSLEMTNFEILDRNATFFMPQSFQLDDEHYQKSIAEDVTRICSNNPTHT